MKKRITLLLLSALLLTNTVACSPAEQGEVNGTQEQTQREGTVADSTASTDSEASAEEGTGTTTETKTPVISETPNISLNELREKLGCYVATESTNYLQQLKEQDGRKIVAYTDGDCDCASNMLHIETKGSGFQYRYTILLSKVTNKSSEYYGNFINEKEGFLIVFNTYGAAVSPLPDIELHAILKTEDGGRSWQIIEEYQDYRVSNSRQYINSAFFFTNQIGFFTARYCTTDNGFLRTRWTFDGGKTWQQMPDIELPDIMGALGLSGKEYATEVTDANFADGVYTVTFRLCSGYSYLIDGEPQSLFFTCTSTDFKTWELVKEKPESIPVQGK